MFRIMRIIVMLGFMLLALPVVGQDAKNSNKSHRRVESMKEELKGDIEKARQELSDLNETIARERTQLADKLASVRTDIDRLEDDLARKKKARRERLQMLETLREETDEWREQVSFVNSLVEQDRRSFASRLSAAQQQRYDDVLKTIDEQLKSDHPTERVNGVPTLLKVMKEHVQNCVEGDVFEGRALDQKGRVLEGQFAQVGPLCYFSGQHGTAGVAFQRTGSVLPTVYDDFASPRDTGEIQRLVDEGTGRVPVDVTAGSAIEMSDANGGLVNHLKKGGLTMIPLLGLAVICALVGFYKFIVLHLMGTGGAEDKVETILDAIHSGDVERARDIAGGMQRPLGPVLVEGVDHHDVPKEHVEEIMYERLLSQIPALEKYLAVLAVGASAAPLLGLLGTVTGMIHTFKLITIFGTGEASNLSAGISEALITTEVGLIIAVPALLVHAYLSRRVKKTISSAQQAAIMFVNGLKLKSKDDE